MDLDKGAAEPSLPASASRPPYSRPEAEAGRTSISVITGPSNSVIVLIGIIIGIRCGGWRLFGIRRRQCRNAWQAGRSASRTSLVLPFRRVSWQPRLQGTFSLEKVTLSVRQESHTTCGYGATSTDGGNTPLLAQPNRIDCRLPSRFYTLRGQLETLASLICMAVSSFSACGIRARWGWRSRPPFRSGTLHRQSRAEVG